jgi:pimeloyl-ACP methyl ester carboxylesterase
MPWKETPAELERAWAEQPMIVPGPMGRLIGIYTPAAPSARPSGMCVIFLARPRFEQRRVVVELARRLASEGFNCFRYDQHGWGESDGELKPIDIDHPSRGELFAVLRHLRRLGEKKFVFWGLCLDARLALSIFPDEPDIVEGLVFLSAPASRLVSPKVFSWRNLLRWTLDRERWRELFFSKRSRQQARDALKFILRGTLKTSLDTLSPEFLNDFRALVRSHARALFLYGSEDGEYQSFRLAEQQLFPKLDAPSRERLELQIWPGGVHSVNDIHRQREIVEKSFTWIQSLHPAYAQPVQLAASAG